VKSKSGKNVKNQQRTKNKKTKVVPLTRKEKFIKAWNSVNLANKLTILRIALVPLFLVMATFHSIPHSIVWALLIFVGASVTDWLDGHIARTRMMVTPLGQFLDPIADKVLVTSALVVFAGLGWIHGTFVALIIGRDLIVSAVRLVAAESEEKLIIPARTSGKVKTVITMVTISLILFLWTLGFYEIISLEGEIEMPFIDRVATVGGADIDLLRALGNAFMAVCTALTLFSGAQYVWDARYLLKEQLLDDKSKPQEESEEEPEDEPEEENSEDSEDKK
jgi:CDP-diacylglycerol--glycerol-3-phosphate 3-phosphatidyltransferase